MVHVPVQTVFAERDDGSRPMAPDDRGQLGLKFGDVVPSKVTIGIVADKDLRYIERLSRLADFECSLVAKLVVPSCVDRAAALAVRGGDDDHAKSLEGETRQGATTGQRLVIGMREHREDRTSGEHRIDHDWAAARGLTPAIRR